MRIISTILLLILLGVGKINAQLLALTLKPERINKENKPELGIKILPDSHFSYDSLAIGAIPLNKIPSNAKIFIHDDRSVMNLVRRLNSNNPIYLKSKNDLIPLNIEVIDSTSSSLCFAILRPSRQMIPNNKYVLYCPTIWEYQKNDVFFDASPYAWISSNQLDNKPPVLNRISIEDRYMVYDSTDIPQYVYSSGLLKIDAELDGVYARVSIRSKTMKKYDVHYLLLENDIIDISSMLKEKLFIGNGDTCEIKVQLIDICGNKSAEKKANFIFIDDFDDTAGKMDGSIGQSSCCGTRELDCGGHNSFWSLEILFYVFFLMLLVFILYRRQRKHKNDNKQ
jgi:cbb3-type cytochrome oxidase subunit 3